jgi:histidinol phosphatase-like PHP family hydrolase/predicted nuclease with RNAse H fold/dephospho-CoA kinase
MVVERNRSTNARFSNMTRRAVARPSKRIPDDYFRIRDFEYVQPLYDLAFLLEIDALANEFEVPKYRTFSLWRAGLSLDSYSTTIDRWLDGTLPDEELDNVPTSRIRNYLRCIKKTGTIPELRKYRATGFARGLRLRSVRGLGPTNIALTISSRSIPAEWSEQATINLNLQRERITRLYNREPIGPWQTAHIVPPLLRFLHSIEEVGGRSFRWSVAGLSDPFHPVEGKVVIDGNISIEALAKGVQRVRKTEKLFGVQGLDGSTIEVEHQMGWRFTIRTGSKARCTIRELINRFDPIANEHRKKLKSDLHLHTAWSDGTASINTMAAAALRNGLKYIAVTDHSRSSKLQSGLTPAMWIRQANALSLARPSCPILHGIEVDILRNGSLDLPDNLLAAADIVVASIHSGFTEDEQENTARIVRAIESGYIDVLAHPTTSLVGKPGVPDWGRPATKVDWDRVFHTCATWGVALEMNCFPSRLDLPIELLARAAKKGCPICFGSDAHSRAHLINLRFGEAALVRLPTAVVLNCLSYGGLKRWISKNRKKRQKLKRQLSRFVQSEFPFDGAKQNRSLKARVQGPSKIPIGSRVVGIDLTAGNKATGIALIEGKTVKTESLWSDADIISFIKKHKPKIVSIDSPLGLPGGGNIVNPKAGIVRVAEQDLASIGIPAYPALIDSMEPLTLRGIRLRKKIEELPSAPKVIESYPGAAQDILAIPRKQKSFELLRHGLARLGLGGPGLRTQSHDEMDAITSGVVARYFEAGDYEPMGIEGEAQLIVPKVYPLKFREPPVLCLAGKTGAGKSVVARYLAVFFGFSWIHTRDLIREIVSADMRLPRRKRLFADAINPAAITERDLQEFGAIILNKYEQAPLRRKLTQKIRRLKGAIVVDSIRGLNDVDHASVVRRPILTWSIDCPDPLIQSRLATRAKLGSRIVKSDSPVDRTVPTVRQHSDMIIPNAGSLEELRWRVDDALFEILQLEP